MQVKKEISNIYELYDNSWAGAVTVLDNIFKNDQEEIAWDIINNYFDTDFTGCETPTETELNDFIWFELEEIIKEYENENE